MNRTTDSPSAVSVNALVFSGGEVWNEDGPDAQANAILQSLAQSLSGPSSTNRNESSRSDEEQNVNAYVCVFEEMVGAVIKEEKHLFDDEEFALLTLFAHLSYNARFLMVKLLLRKQETWHRLDTLKYEGELGSVSAIEKAIDELCKVGDEPPLPVKKEELEEQGCVEPAMDGGVASLQREQDRPASVDAEASGPLAKDTPIALAKNEWNIDLRSLLECLRVDELKAIAKQLKLKKTNQKKDDLIKDLLDASSSQSTLTSYTYRDDVAQPKSPVYQQTKLPFGDCKSQQDRLRQIALRHIGKCVRVDEGFFSVIHRVNIVYFRMTRYTPGILVASVLTRFGKRTYPGYKYKRTRNVWSSRQALIDYEEVLILEAQVDALLAGNTPSLGGRATGSRASAVGFLPTPVTPGNINGRREGGDEDVVPDIKPDTVRVRGARMVKDVFEQVYHRWQDLAKVKGQEDGRENGLERFHPGHVLTRIICKGSTALGILGEHQRELEVLETLLAQKRWRRGQRGKWYERRALILSTHFPKDEVTTERAFDAVVEALRDLDTQIVYRPKLQRRLRTLEIRLKIPPEERHKCEGVLTDASEVTFEAIRLRHRASSLKLDRTGRCVDTDTPQQGNQDIKRYFSPVANPVKPEPTSNVTSPCRKPQSDMPKGKSLWLGRDGEELTVETLALQRYEEQGFKGVHCESRVTSMLFSLLFWDIIFAPIPGAFETPYQTAPLDIAEDSFYHARKDLMEERLADIEAGKGGDLVRDVDAKHRASGTWCVGVQWDLFSTEDIADIITCLGGKALSVICRVLCENYTFGMSGGPDLFLWNVEKCTCKFVEVKGPGDTLQENQKVWIDILLKAPAAVEICRIVEKGAETDKKRNARTPKSTRRWTKKTPRKKEEMLINTEDADALPNTFEDPHDTTPEEHPVPSGGHTLPGPVEAWVVASSASTRNEVVPSPLKRKAGPPEVVLRTPSKRPKPS